jgi:hypothetical protein
MNTGEASILRVDEGGVRVAVGEMEAFLSDAVWAAFVASVAAPTDEPDERLLAVRLLHDGVPVGTELALAFRDGDGNQGVQRIATKEDGDTLAVILKQQSPEIEEFKVVRRVVSAWTPVESS